MTQQTILLATLCLIAVGGAAAAAARWLQARGTLRLPARNRSIIVRETVALDPRRRIHLVEWQEGRVLLLTGGGRDLVLDAAPDRTSAR